MSPESSTIPRVGELRLSAEATGGRMEIIEYSGSAAPPTHVHRDRDEGFYILEGTFTFFVGDETIEAKPTTTLFVPRGTPHRFTHEPGSRAVIVITPAGLEGFFRTLGEGLEAGKDSNEIRAELAGKFESHPV